VVFAINLALFLGPHGMKPRDTANGLKEIVSWDTITRVSRAVCHNQIASNDGTMNTSK